MSQQKIIAAMIAILQKQSNAIRKLTVLNIAVANVLRDHLEDSGIPYEAAERLFADSLSMSEQKGPTHDWTEGISKEIQEIVETLDLLEKQCDPN